MSEIKSASGRRLIIERGSVDPLDTVAIEAHCPDESVAVVPSRADFLAAVRDLGVIVIDKADLPEVHDDGHYLRIDDEPFVRRSGDEHRLWARKHLALASHVDANPPVDEAQVEALAGLIRDIEANGDGYSDVARRLLATGRIEVKP